MTWLQGTRILLFLLLLILLLLLLAYVKTAIQMEIQSLLEETYSQLDSVLMHNRCFFFLLYVYFLFIIII